MNKRTRSASSGNRPSRPRWPAANHLRSFWLAAFTALSVATPLLPSESAASRGTGAVLVTLWWLLLTAWLVAEALQDDRQWRWGPDLTALLLFVVWHSVSALVMAAAGQPRASFNSLWLWLSLAASYFLARQILQSALACRAVAAVMIAVAVGLSVHGYYQYFWSLPQTRMEFARDPEKALRDAGIDAPPGSAERQQYESRLQSTEPLATFALTNSLAGFLTPWLIVVFGVAVARNPQLLGGWRLRTVALASGLLIAGCWILTKSRTAWLATLVGLAATVLGVARDRQWRLRWWHTGLAGLSAAIGIGFGVLSGGLDLLVITEAFKSFSYRVEYWQATWSLIREHPWLGCGPGNFQQYYTAYKLVGASEEVADPHNFLLEIWATAGTPALAAFLAVGAAVVWQVWSRPSPPTPATEPATQPASTRPVYWGALAGLLLAYFPCGYLVGHMPDFAVLLFSAPAAALTIGAWHHWTRDGELSVWLPLVAAAALLLNLLAAGGISFPGVAGSLWILVAMALNLRPGGPACVRVSRTAASLLACLAAVLLLACQHLVYGPVLRAGALLEHGHRAWSAGEMREAERVYLEAAAADPWWDEPWQALAALRHQVWWQQPDDVRFLQFYAALERMLTLNPRSSNARALGADWLAAAYLRAGNKEWLAQALAQCRRAVELYPNEALGHARMALLYELAGSRLEAAREAEVALHLDARTPHQEQKLSRRQAFRFPDGLAPWSGNTEQLLQQLRNAQKQN